MDHETKIGILIALASLAVALLTYVANRSKIVADQALELAKWRAEHTVRAEQARENHAELKKTVDTHMDADDDAHKEIARWQMRHSNKMVEVRAKLSLP